MEQEQKTLTPPVKVGDKIKAGIVGWGKQGNPIVKVKGFVIYIEKFEEKPLHIKELLYLRITKVFTRFGFCQIIK